MEADAEVVSARPGWLYIVQYTPLRLQMALTFGPRAYRVWDVWVKSIEVRV